MKLKLVARRAESPGVESFIFKPEKPLVWKAGQFLHYVLNHAPTDDRGSDRWFTIASAPFERHVMITTRFTSKHGSTFKKTLKALKPGNAIEISDLDGDFIVSDPKKQYVFIAGGIGITPFRSILKQAEHEKKRCASRSFTPIERTSPLTKRNLMRWRNEIRISKSITSSIRNGSTSRP
jgi:ferredoxin-NADP reductase